MDCTVLSLPQLPCHLPELFEDELVPFSISLRDCEVGLFELVPLDTNHPS